MSQTRIMLVTGGGIGIGRACALAFARSGHHVIVTDVLETEGRELARTIVDSGGKACFRLMDVRSTSQVDDVIAEMNSRFGAIDALVLNAGIAHRVPLAELDDSRWDHTVDIDYVGLVPI